MSYEQIRHQKQAIAAYINSGKELDSFKAINYFGCTKLSTRIGELEKDNKIPIVKRGWKAVKTRYCNKVMVRTYQIVK